MNAIQHAINEIKHRIPKALLDEAFKSSFNRDSAWARRHAPVINIDYRIRQEVIEKRVIPHINLKTGHRIRIPLSGIRQEYLDDFTCVMQIPKDRTQGRSITQVFSIIAGTPIGTMGGIINQTYNGTNDLVDALNAVKQSRSPIPMVEDANIEIIGDNLIHLTAPIRQSGFLYLDCSVQHDDSLSQLPPAAWQCFSKLVEYAVKAYIYNECVIPVDVARISGGSEIGRFREILDSYSDANDNFDEELNKWQVVHTLTDPQSRKTHLQSVAGGLY